MPKTTVYGAPKRQSAAINVRIFPGMAPGDGKQFGSDSGQASTKLVLKSTRKQWGLPRKELAAAVGIAAAAEVWVRVSPPAADGGHAAAADVAGAAAAAADAILSAPQVVSGASLAPSLCLLSESRASFDLLMGLGPTGDVLVMPSSTPAALDGGGSVGPVEDDADAELERVLRLQASAPAAAAATATATETATAQPPAASSAPATHHTEPTVLLLDERGLTRPPAAISTLSHLTRVSLDKNKIAVLQPDMLDRSHSTSARPHAPRGVRPTLD